MTIIDLCTNECLNYDVQVYLNSYICGIKARGFDKGAFSYDVYLSRMWNGNENQERDDFLLVDSLFLFILPF